MCCVVLCCVVLCCVVLCCMCCMCCGALSYILYCAVIRCAISPSDSMSISSPIDDGNVCINRAYLHLKLNPILRNHFFSLISPSTFHLQETFHVPFHFLELWDCLTLIPVTSQYDILYWCLSLLCFLCHVFIIFLSLSTFLLLSFFLPNFVFFLPPFHSFHPLPLLSFFPSTSSTLFHPIHFLYSLSSYSLGGSSTIPIAEARQFERNRNRSTSQIVSTVHFSRIWHIDRSAWRAR